MTSVRRLALSKSNAVRERHVKYPDFRVGKKIFSTLGYPDAKSGKES